MSKLLNLIILISLISMGLITNLYALPTKSNIILKGKAPEGVVIGKNKVTVKKGYVFEKMSNGHVVSRMRGGRGGITGDFDCTCNGTAGGCTVTTTPTSVSCSSSGCTSSCYMIVNIPGTSSTLHP